MKLLPFLGLDQRNNPLLVADHAASEAKNVDLHPVGTVRARAGCRSLAEVDEGVSSAVLDVAMLHKADGTDYLYAVTANGLFRSAVSSDLSFAEREEFTSGATSAVLERGRYVHNSNAASPTDYGQAIYMANGEDRPWVDSGGASEDREIPAAVYGNGSTNSGTHGIPAGTTTTADTSLEFRDWTSDPPSGFYLMGRGADDQMLAWGFDGDPERVDYSEVARPWNWVRRNVDDATADPVPAVDGGWFYAGDGDGDPVVGVWKILDKLVVFKKEKTYVYGGDPGDGLYRQAVYPVGCSSFKSIVQAGNELFWWSEQGPVSLSGVEQYGDLGLVAMGAPVWEVAADVVNTERYKQICAYHDPVNFRVVWSIPSDLISDTAIGVVMYYDSPARWSYYEGPICDIRSAIRADGSWGTGGIIGGTPDGTIQHLHYGSTDLEEEIDSYWIGRWQDLGDAATRSRVLDMAMLVGSDGAINASIATAWDYTHGDSKWVESTGTSRMYGDPGAYFDSARFDVDAFDSTATGVRVYEMPASGHFFRFRVKGDAPWTVDGWALLASEKGRP